MSGLIHKLRPAWIFLALAVFGLVLAVWAVVEARLQRTETSEALAAQARMLANTLGPSLGAAAAASRELKELLAWRLLDNAQYIARLHAAGKLSQSDLVSDIDDHELDSVTIIDRSGQVVMQAGDDIPVDLRQRSIDASTGGADDMILGPTTEMGIDHLAVATALPDGGVVVVRIHSATGQTFARQLGVENLLSRLLESEGVLYLGFRQDPEGIRHEVSWDGGPLPSLDDSGSELRQVRDHTVFEIEVPVASPAGSSAFLQVGLDGAPLVRTTVSAMRRTMLIGVVLVIFSLSLLGIALVSHRRMTERVEADRKLDEAEAARRRSERLAAAGALTAGLAHEIRGPLNAIVLAAQRIERKHPPESECHSFAGTIRTEVRRLDTVLRQFLDLARPVSENREATDLRLLAEDVRDLLFVEAEGLGVALEPVQGSGETAVDSGSIRRAIINLVHNAMDASTRGGSIDLVVREELGGVGIHVLDRGSGLDETIAGDLFDAFVTTRAGGTGLGLALVRRIAEDHGGTCRLTNRAGGGAESELWLPLIAPGEPSP
jgi:signal transduction histidine kinase